MARSVTQSTMRSVPVRDDFIETMAAFTPDDLRAAMARLISSKSMDMEQANDVYTRVMRRKIVLEARQLVLEASEEVSVHDIRSIGRMRTLESDAEAKKVRAHLEMAVDNLILESQRSVVARWKLIAVVSGMDHGSPASSR